MSSSSSFGSKPSEEGVESSQKTVNKFTVKSLKDIGSLPVKSDAVQDKPLEEKVATDKLFHGEKGTMDKNANFGSTLADCSHRRSGESTSSFFVDLGLGMDSWSSRDEPCSSAQADDRDKAAAVRQTSSDTFADSGYVSQPPIVSPAQLSAVLATIKPDIEAKKIVVKKSAKKVAVKKLAVKDSCPEYKRMIIDWDIWFNGCYYGHRLIEMTKHMTASASPSPERKGLKQSLKKVMPLLFGKSHKSPADVVKALREALIALDKIPGVPTTTDKNDKQEKKLEKALDDVSKNVSMIKAFIYGSDSAEPSSEHIVQVAQLAQEVYNANVLPMMVKLLPRLEFECKKDVGQIFNNLLRRQIGTRSPTVEYLGARPEILLQLVQGYSYTEIAIICGGMLRESIRHDHLAKIILYSDVFYTFFTYVQSEVFDIASDAFSTFKDLTTRHKALAAEFLDANYDTFFGQYQNLLNSTNYVTRRQSLKLLGELLLDRHNFNIMTKYISNPDNLKLMMELLRDKSRNIQYEAFHVFKVFVANPNKPKPISDILLRNRDKLVEFLGEFHNDRTDDEQFNDEKAYLIKQIQEMKSSPKEPKKKKEGEQTATPAASEHQ